MLKPEVPIDPLLMRPFSLLEFNASSGQRPNGSLTFLIDAVGKATSALKRLAVGDRLSVLGPLGCGFPAVAADERLIILAGGIGVASVLGLARLYPDMPFFYGIRNERQLFPLEKFGYDKENIHLASDDGSIGQKGSVLELLETYISRLRRSYDGTIKIYACGPNIMYRVMSEMKLDADVFVSLETPMACGIGTCLGCAVSAADGLKMVCKDGPVFNLKDILWDW